MLLILPGFYNELKVVRYELPAEGMARPVRIALVTDLHSCAYGDGQETLLKAIDAQGPDVILLGGDIFDDDMPNDNAAVFLRGVGGRYPCYYVTGNHEYWRGEAGLEQEIV